MRKLIAVIIFTLGVLAWHADAHASCTTTTYIINGRVTMCQTCCYGGACTVSCF